MKHIITFLMLALAPLAARAQAPGQGYGIGGNESLSQHHANMAASDAAMKQQPQRTGLPWYSPSKAEIAADRARRAQNKADRKARRTTKANDKFATETLSEFQSFDKWQANKEKEARKAKK